MSESSWSVYLSGEIHSDWRERIQPGAESAGLSVEVLAPVTEPAASDDAGVDILGAEQNSFGMTIKARRSIPSAPVL